MRNLFFCLAIAVIAASCDKTPNEAVADTNYKCYVQCLEYPVDLVFKGYADTALTTVIEKVYKSNSRFDSLETTKTFSCQPDVIYNAQLRSTNEYEIILPGIDTFRVWKFVNTPTGYETTCDARHPPSRFQCFYYDHVAVDDDTSQHLFVNEQHRTVVTLQKK